MAYADLALGKIKELAQPGDPRTYAAWFTYATKCNPSQNILVDQTIARKGSISAAELEAIYGYAPANLITDNVDDLAARVADEIDQISAVIDGAAGTIAAYRDDLVNVTDHLDRARDAQGLGRLVETLIEATQGVETTSEAFAASLRASKQQLARLQEKMKALRIDSRTDALTSLADRKHFDDELDRRIAEAESTGEGLCLLLMDVDHLKDINEMFGHMAGDEVLRVVSHALKQHLQPGDVAARVGGEEFAVILPKIQLRSALTVADHVRCRVMAANLTRRATGESIGRVTVSGGIACYRAGENPWTLMRRADSCLFAAKRHGRNRVICDNDDLSNLQAEWIPAGMA